MYYWPLNAFRNVWFMSQNNLALAVDLEYSTNSSWVRIMVKARLGCTLQNEAILGIGAFTY